jgi:polyhydroxyalkanoate synthase
MPAKRNYWRNDRLTDDPDEWLARAAQVPGSWWTHWDAWIAAHGGKRRKSPSAVGDDAHPALMPAPGSYVVEKVSA